MVSFYEILFVGLEVRVVLSLMGMGYRQRIGKKHAKGF
jgi:hypothetical protein